MSSTLDNLLESYRRDHTHPVNKAMHAVGIPVIALSLPVLLFDWRWAAGLFVGGWILQFVGHAFEGKRPSFMRDPRFLAIGAIWTLRRVLRLERKAEVPQGGVS